MSFDYREIIPFFTKKENDVSVLLVNNTDSVVVVKKYMPNAKIYMLVETFCEFSQDTILCKLVDSSIQEVHSFAENSFDYIIVGEVFESLNIVENSLKLYLFFLKECGEVVASFKNNHHWKEMKKVSASWTYKNQTNQKEQGFSLMEIIQMFERTKYKDLEVAASYDNGPSQLLEELNRLGISNENDELNVAYWGVSARKVNKKSFLLRQSFSGLIRENMVFLLRRIENGIDVDTNSHSLCLVCQEKEVEYSYIVDLAYNALINPAKALYLLAIYLYENKKEKDAIVLLTVVYQTDPKKDLIIYALASFLCLQKQERVAIKILFEYKGTDADVLRLKEQLRG